MMMVGVIGSERGVGTTHTALGIGTGLRGKERVAFLDKSGHQSVLNLGLALGELESRSEGDYFRYRSIDYFLNDVGIATYNKNYDVLITDYGTEYTEELLRNDYIFVVLSGRDWHRESEESYSFIERIEDGIGMENVYVVVPFADKSSQRFFKEMFPDTKLYFPKYEADPLDSITSDYGFLCQVKGFKKKFKLFESKISELEKSKEEAETKQAELESEIKNQADELRKKEASISSYTKEIAEKETRLQENEQKAKELEQRLYVSRHDELTGLPNRREYMEDIGNLTNSYILVYMDVNGLKETNDRYGHSKGDVLLKTIVQVITSVFKNVYRIGGDEFVAVSDIDEFSPDKLQKIDNMLSDITKERSDGITYELAHGYSSSEEGTFEEICNLADKRMYEDKQAKKALWKHTEEKSSDIACEETSESISKNHDIAWYTNTNTNTNTNADITDTAPSEYSDTESEVSSDMANPFPIDTVISNTLPFGEDEPFRKYLDTMHFKKIVLSYEFSRFNEVALWIFATEYKKPPYGVRTIVVYESSDGYELAYGQHNKITIDNAEFTVSGRFTKNGEFTVGIIPSFDTIKILNREETCNHGRYTPKHFGFCFKGMEFYPIRQNINGTCDMAVLKDGQVYISHGDVETEDGHYEFVLSGEVLDVCES